MSALGRTLIILGAVSIGFGVLVSFGDRLPIRLGRMPGDFVWRGKNSVVYLPVTTCILLSVVMSVIMWLFNRMR